MDIVLYWSSGLHASGAFPPRRRRALPCQHGLLLNLDAGHFVINQNDVATRQRFTKGEDDLKLGARRGRSGCENRAQQVEGERMVLSLVHLPEDRGCSGAAVIGEGEELRF